jgi:hypothetical protein
LSVIVGTDEQAVSLPLATMSVFHHRCGHDGQRKCVAHMAHSDKQQQQKASFKIGQNHPHDFTMKQN